MRGDDDIQRFKKADRQFRLRIIFQFFGFGIPAHFVESSCSVYGDIDGYLCSVISKDCDNLASVGFRVAINADSNPIENVGNFEFFRWQDSALSMRFLEPVNCEALDLTFSQFGDLRNIYGRYLVFLCAGIPHDEVIDSHEELFDVLAFYFRKHLDVLGHKWVFAEACQTDDWLFVHGFRSY